mmetsp:Transcript_96484/g.150839  ORF Transcript_96484/g.150839 Transcript_96484/m.150839 type:complete len:200 (+) Transcript_96484:779-1378(+)
MTVHLTSSAFARASSSALCFAASSAFAVTSSSACCLVAASAIALASSSLAFARASSSANCFAASSAFALSSSSACCLAAASAFVLASSSAFCLAASSSRLFLSFSSRTFLSLSSCSAFDFSRRWSEQTHLPNCLSSARINLGWKVILNILRASSRFDAPTFTRASVNPSCFATPACTFITATMSCFTPRVSEIWRANCR